MTLTGERRRATGLRRISANALVVAVVLLSAAWWAATAGAFVYRGNANGGTIERFSNSGGDPIPDFITGASAPLGITVDGGHIYWANATHGSSGTIGRASLDGTDVAQAFIAGIADVRDVAVSGQYIYWTSYDGWIGRAGLDGTGVDQHFIDCGCGPVGLAVDADHIYWTDISGVARADLDGTNVDTAFVADANNLEWVAVDGQYVFWTDTNNNQIGRANIDGTDVIPNLISTGGTPYALSLNGGYVYWGLQSDGDGFGRASLDGSSVDTNFLSGNGSIGGVAADDLPLPPTAQITTPSDAQSFTVGQSVATTFACAEGVAGPGLTSCVDSNGSAAPDGHLDTSTPGTHNYTVTATSSDGQSANASIAYTVTAPPVTTTTTTTTTPPPPTTTTTTPTAPPSTASPAPPNPAPAGAAAPTRLWYLAVAPQPVTWCAGCRYPRTRLRFFLNHAAPVRVVLRVRRDGHWQPVGIVTLRGRGGANSFRLAGRWHGQMVPARRVEIVVELRSGDKWSPRGTLQVSVRSPYTSKLLG